MLRGKSHLLIVVTFCLAMASTGYVGTEVKVNTDTDTTIQNEPTLTINRHFVGDPLNMVAAYNDIGNTLGSSYSSDSGKTWTDTQLLFEQHARTASTRRFEIGFWCVLAEDPFPGYVSQNEKDLLNEIGATWLYGTTADPYYVDFCNETGGEIRVCVGSYCDDCFYWECCPEQLVDNYGATANNYPDSAWIANLNTFIDTLINSFAGSAGLAGYIVGHENPECCYPSYWNGLEYICSRLKQVDPDTTHHTFFSGYVGQAAYGFLDSIPSLDMIDAFLYVIEWGLPYNGPQFQSALDQLIARYDQAMIGMRDYDIQWRAGFATSSWHGVWRMPTPAEVRCQAFLGLTRGTRGIMYFRFCNDLDGQALVLPGQPRVKAMTWLSSYPGGSYCLFDAVRDLNADLKVVGPYMLDLYPLATFTSNDDSIPTTFVDTAWGDYIEVGTLLGTVDSLNYFVLVNRVCNNADGSPANPQAVQVALSIDPVTPDSMLLILDLLTGDSLHARYCGGSYVMRTDLGPGDGRLYQINKKVINPGGLDSDSDGIDDGCDNCLGTANSDQQNTDADSFGDACDNCPNTVNPAQVDTDSDGVGNVCDNCVDIINPSQEDYDSDNIGDSCDNCTQVFNPDQENDDTDSLGNACDNCPDNFNPGQEDTDGDGVGDACCCHLRGDVERSNSITVSDITYLVAYLFQGGSSPPCPEEGDVDGTGGIDVGDLTYLVAYMFQGGPAPPAC